MMNIHGSYKNRGIYKNSGSGITWKSGIEILIVGLQMESGIQNGKSEIEKGKVGLK